MTTNTVTILAFEGCMGMEVFGLADTLQLANRVALAIEGRATPLFAVKVVSVRGGEVAAAGGMRIGTVRSGGRGAATGLLAVPGMQPGGRDECIAALARLGPEVALIRRSFSKGVPVAAMCVGAFLAGEAGLLDGRRATTSWLFAGDLQRRYPQARVDGTAMLVDDGGVTTTGAYSATFDLALHLVRRAASPKVWRAVARLGLIDSGRASQAPFVDMAMLPRPAGGFAASVMAWMEARLAETYELDAIAVAFHVSPRTLLRRFRDEAGCTPLSHLQDARIARAKILLESTGQSVAQITAAVGYGDVATFGVLFKRLAGQPPAAYRRRFRHAAIKQ
jgi:transcriptional regulator GlxA family with amidase domain